MSKVLVTYATKSGSVTDIAEAIAARLAAAGMDVDVKPVGEGPDAGAYDAVVVGSGVRAGSWHAPAKEWVQARAEQLKSRRVAFFTVGLTQATAPEKADEVKAYTDPLSAETGVTPVDVGAFAGWFVPERFGFAERSILKLMKAPAGDFRDTTAAADWAAAIAPKLSA